MLPNRDKDATGRTYLVQLALKSLGFYSGVVDNWRGPKTDAAEAAWLKSVTKPAPMDSEFSPRAMELIREFEGYDQPEKWPGGSSGITIGIGYDLGYADLASFRADWSGKMAPDHLSRLETAIGLKGQIAKGVAQRYRDITISHESADEVFLERTLPKWREQTSKAFPGVEKLPLDAQGALVSLVFNRGTSMRGETRREMARIRDIIAEPQDVNRLHRIAEQIRSMKRLWRGKGLDGLLRRRDAEADLVESAT